MSLPLLVCVNRYNAGNSYETAGTIRFLRVLDALGVDYVVKKPGDVSTTQSLAYSGCLLLNASSGHTDCKPWMKGNHSIPVFVVGADWSGDLVKATGCETGADAGIDSGEAGYPTASFYITDGTYKVYCCNSGSEGALYTLNTNGTAVWTASAGTAGLAAVWKLATKDVYFTRFRYPIFCVLYALRLAGLTPAKPYALRIDLDDMWGIGDQGIGGLEDLIAWARTKGAVLLCGVDATSAACMEHTTARAVLQANSDVCKIVDHVHTVNAGATYEYLYDDTAYPTVASKIAERQRVIGILQAAGYRVSEDGYLGHYHLPYNRASIKGLQALAKMGVKVVRAVAPISGTNSFGYNSCPFVYDDGTIRYTMRMVKGCQVLCGNDTPNQAKVVDKQSTKEENFTLYMAQSGWMMLDMVCSCDYQGFPAPGPIAMEHVAAYADTTHLPARQASTDYAVSDIVVPSDYDEATYNGFYYRCTVAGTTSSGADPTWPTTTNGTVNDGTVTWKLDSQVSSRGGDNPGLWVLQAADELVRFSNGWLKWAGYEDLIRMASTFVEKDR
jgi:hypothetical protein